MTQLLLVIPSLQGGGAERVMLTLLRHLDRTKFRLALAVADTRSAVYKDDIPPDVDFIDLHCSRVLQAMPRLIKLIWKRRPNIVFSTLSHFNLAIAVLRPLLPKGVSYIARESSVVSEVIKSYVHTTWWAWAYRRFYGRLDRLICQSTYMRQDLIDHFEFPPAKAIVINNPVDIEYIHRLAVEPVAGVIDGTDSDLSSVKPVNLVAVGRLAVEKGYDLLLEGLALSGNKRLRVTFIGDGPLRGQLESIAHSKGLSKQVRFLGFKKNPYPYIAKADAVVMSSRFEGFPNVVLEALACGTPVIAVPSPGGIREILEGMDGCMIADGVSAKALAKALNAFKGHSRTSRNVVAPYSTDTIVKQYERVLLSEVCH